MSTTWIVLQMWVTSVWLLQAHNSDNNRKEKSVKAMDRDVLLMGWLPMQPQDCQSQGPWRRRSSPCFQHHIHPPAVAEIPRGRSPDDIPPMTAAAAPHRQHPYPTQCVARPQHSSSAAAAHSRPGPRRRAGRSAALPVQPSTSFAGTAGERRRTAPGAALRRAPAVGRGTRAAAAGKAAAAAAGSRLVARSGSTAAGTAVVAGTPAAVGGTAAAAGTAAGAAATAVGTAAGAAAMAAGIAGGAVDGTAAAATGWPRARPMSSRTTRRGCAP
eukprot:365910-Chlamydomonas_euryale.AAC.44